MLRKIVSACVVGLTLTLAVGCDNGPAPANKPADAPKADAKPAADAPKTDAMAPAKTDAKAPAGKKIKKGPHTTQGSK